MIIEWLKLSAALALLLVPTALFHTRRVRYRAITRDWDQHWKPILSLGLHSIDLGRAILGAWLLLIAVTRDPAARGLMRHTPLLVHGGVLTLAVLLQTVSCKERDAFHAPFAFVTGIIFGYFAPVVAGFAVLFAFIIAAGVRTPSLYFPMLAISLGCAGFLFSGQRLSLQMVIGGCAVIVPWMLALLFRRPLMITYRSRRQDTRSQVPDPATSQSPFDSSAAKR